MRSCAYCCTTCWQISHFGLMAQTNTHHHRQLLHSGGELRGTDTDRTEQHRQQRDSLSTHTVDPARDIRVRRRIIIMTRRRRRLRGFTSEGGDAAGETWRSSSEWDAAAAADDHTHTQTHTHAHTHLSASTPPLHQTHTHTHALTHTPLCLYPSPSPNTHTHTHTQIGWHDARASNITLKPSC